MARWVFVIVIGLAAACGGEPEPVPELACGTAGNLLDLGRAEELADVAACTSLLGGLRFGDTSFAVIDGLDHVHTIAQGLNFFRNVRLVEISALGRLETVGGDLFVHHNDALLDLAFAQLERVAGELYLSNNNLLESLAGFAHLREVGALRIVNNAQLRSLADLPDLVVHGDLVIEGNPALARADAETFAARCTVSGTIVIADNAR